MSWFVDLRRFALPKRDQIGPGRLILVVGPSGAGKDTLIDGARSACIRDPMVAFPRRVITRPSSLSENNATVSEDSFIRLMADGEFALSWDAHCHRYGIPSLIDDDIRAGRTVVCNVSRTVLGHARRRYALVTVVLVTAPPHILQARVAHRARPSDGEIRPRIARSANLANHCSPDVVISNTGRPSIGIRRLLNVINDGHLFVVY
jgi:ribose 1,5-bisphosphokinase